jgi:nitroimidazol reductase NimA-like FMN-containing flavoprotein (pyridoxamine 5'-phosphate oxidase superfamily)
MIRVCCECKKVFGEKEPLEDRSETHGICEKCFPKVMKRFKEEIKKYEKNNSSKE